MNLTEKRKNTLVSIAYFTVFAAIYFLFVKYAFGMVAPFIFALLIAMILQRPINYISSKTPLRKKPLSVVFVLLIVAVLIGLAVLVGYRLWAEFYDFGKYIAGKLNDTESIVSTLRLKLNGVLSHFPEVVGKAVNETVDGFTDKLLNYTKENQELAEGTHASSAGNGLSISSIMSPIGGILSTAMQIPAILAALLIGIVACFFLTSDYDNFVVLIKNCLTEEHVRSVARTKHIIVDILGKWCKSYAILMFITFCEMALGLSVLKLAGLYKGGYIFVIAVCTAIVDILPVFGTGTVIIPWAVISLFTHKVGLGIGLIVIYVIITVLRQVLEPRLVSMNVGMHPVITLMGMYIGLQLFGAIGLILLPITLVIIKTLNAEGVIHIYGQEKLKKAKEQAKEKTNKKQA